MKKHKKYVDFSHFSRTEGFNNSAAEKKETHESLFSLRICSHLMEKKMSLREFQTSFGHKDPPTSRSLGRVLQKRLKRSHYKNASSFIGNRLVWFNQTDRQLIYNQHFCSLKNILLTPPDKKRWVMSQQCSTWQLIGGDESLDEDGGGGGGGEGKWLIPASVLRRTLGLY